MRSAHGHGEPSPTWIPAAHRAVRLLAEELGGIAGGSGWDLFSIPTTAHFLGGCAIGDSPTFRGIDPYHRVYGHPGLHIVDGSAVSANLGVNPSLTITAQAERAMAAWPNRGEAIRTAARRALPAGRGRSPGPPGCAGWRPGSAARAYIAARRAACGGRSAVCGLRSWAAGCVRPSTAGGLRRAAAVLGGGLAWAVWGGSAV